MKKEFLLNSILLRRKLNSIHFNLQKKVMTLFQNIKNIRNHRKVTSDYYLDRSPVHTFSKTQNNRILLIWMMKTKSGLILHVQLRIGIKSGDYVKLKNQDGIVSNKIKVKATERIRKDCVYMTHGFGHNSKMLKQALS